MARPRSRRPLDIEVAIDMIIAGRTYRQMAKYFRVSYGSMYRFLHHLDHSARTREALALSADILGEDAESILKAAIGAPMPVVIASNHLAQHLRWRASKRNPKRFGDRVEVMDGVTYDFAARLDEATKRYKEEKKNPPSCPEPGLSRKRSTGSVQQQVRTEAA